MADSNQGPSWADLLNQFSTGGGTGDFTDNSASSKSTEGGSGSGKRGGRRSRGSSSLDFSALSERFAGMSKKGLIVLVVVIVLIAAFCYWWFHPPINIHSTNLWIFLVIFIILPLLIVFFAFYQIYSNGMGKREKSEKKAKRYKYLMAIPLIIALVGVVGAVLSLDLFPGNAQKYATILETEEGDFSEEITEADYSTIPFIDADSAELLGNRTLGELADYVSQFEISSLYSQINYNDEPVRVSPLNYADIFKWWTNKDTGIPAYVIVNMSTQDTEIVRLGDDAIYYSESDPFFKNVDRHVQLSYPFYIFGDKSFEIDDDGRPYWVYPVLDYTIGLFGGQTVSRIILCDASTGECEDIAIEDVPSWIDRAYPSDLLIQQYNWSGSLASGWINSWLGQSGVKQTTPGESGENGYNYIALDDDVWVYSGVTSATSDDAIIGFVLINQRTAESKFYSVSGATETSAMESAEGQVQNLEYVSTFPLLINVKGQPTYFMALKDDAGLVKKYAMIDIQRYQNVAVGDTLEETESSYVALLKTNGVELEESDDDSGGTTVTDGSATGTIATISPVVLDGDSHYYILLSGDDTLYDCPVASVVDVVRFSEGDYVTLTFESSDASVVEVDSIEDASSDEETESEAAA